MRPACRLYAYTGLMKTLPLRMLKSVEMCAQEVHAWWVPIATTNELGMRATAAIPTMMPRERHCARKRKVQMDAIVPVSSVIWTNNTIEKYDERPQSLETLSRSVADLPAG